MRSPRNSWPTDKDTIVWDFMSMNPGDNFPNIIGANAIDGCHVPIAKPLAHRYYMRKKIHSIILQAVVSAISEMSASVALIGCMMPRTCVIQLYGMMEMHCAESQCHTAQLQVSSLIF